MEQNNSIVLYRVVNLDVWIYWISYMFNKNISFPYVVIFKVKVKNIINDSKRIIVLLRINNWFSRFVFYRAVSFSSPIEESLDLLLALDEWIVLFRATHTANKLGFNQFNLHCKRRGNRVAIDENNTGNDESTALYSSRCVISILSTLTSDTK